MVQRTRCAMWAAKSSGYTQLTHNLKWSVTAGRQIRNCNLSKQQLPDRCRHHSQSFQCAAAAAARSRGESSTYSLPLELVLRTGMSPPDPLRPCRCRPPPPLLLLPTPALSSSDAGRLLLGPALPSTTLRAAARLFSSCRLSAKLYSSSTSSGYTPPASAAALAVMFRLVVLTTADGPAAAAPAALLLPAP